MIKSFSIALKRFNCFELVEFLAKVLTLIRATYFSAYRKLSSRLPKIFLKGCDIRVSIFASKCRRSKTATNVNQHLVQ